MISALRLTIRIHRFEVAVAALVGGAFALSLIYMTLQIQGLGIPDGCWPRDIDGRYGLPECQAALRRLWRFEDGGASWIRAVLPFVPIAVGVLLGVPLVSREIELRTAEMAWSLSRRRSRWLLQRLVPATAIGLLIVSVLALLAWWHFEALAQAREWPRLSEVASFGIGLAARGLLAMGAGLLLGAITGRTMPALVLAVLGLLAWSMLAAPMIDQRIARHQAVWQAESTWRTGEGYLSFIRSRRFDVTTPGIEGEPGQRVNRERSEALRLKTCGANPGRQADDDVANAYDDCIDRFSESIRWSKVIPQSAFHTVQVGGAAVDLTVGGLAVLLSFAVVARRRPT